MSFDFKERDQDLCRTVLEAFGYIERYLEGVEEEEFRVDSKTQDAVTMRLQQILECTSKLSSEVKSSLQINWSALTAMRNKISHSYVDVDSSIVWQVVREFEEFQKLIEWARKNITSDD